MKVDLQLVGQRLYEAPGILDQICRDYRFEAIPESPDELVTALWAKFGQTPANDPLQEQPDNQVVFRAVVRSLGSNSRSWSTYLRGEPELTHVLFEFDPVTVAGAHAEGRLSLENISRWLPGTSSSGDARAILQWAARLSGKTEFHEELQAVGAASLAAAKRHIPGGLQSGEMFLCVVGFLGYPPTPHRWPGYSYLPTYLKDRSASEWKLSGMGYALTSEMLRNLRWDGYKVDRHIMRLLDRWVPDVVDACQGRAAELASLVGTRNQNLLEMLSFSLAGMAIAPDNVPRSHVDNLIWALGAYVEKKGRESELEYVKR